MTTPSRNWFAVDRDRLRKLTEQHGKGRIIAELVQNALDENVTTVAIHLDLQTGRPAAELAVEDNSPDGFRDLAHADTLDHRNHRLRQGRPQHLPRRKRESSPLADECARQVKRMRDETF